MESEALGAAEAALDRGDFGGARRLLRGMTGLSEEGQERRQRLLWRLRPDWVVGLQLGGSLLLFVVVVAITLSR